MPLVKTVAGSFFKGYSTIIFEKGMMARGMQLHISHVGNVHLVKPASPELKLVEFRGAAKGRSCRGKAL